MADLIHAILYPFANRKNLFNYIITALLNVFWFLLIPLFFVNGYLVKMIRNTIQGNENMPRWSLNRSELWYMLKHGFFFTLILFAYLMIPFLLAYFGTSGITIGIADIEAGIVPSASGFSWTFIILSGISLLIVLFILPMALVFYSGTESVVQAFNIPEMFSKILPKIGEYLLIYFVGIFVWLIALFIGGFLSIFMGVVTLYPWIFLLHAVAQIFAETQ